MELIKVNKDINKTFTVELTEDELKVIELCIGATSIDIRNLIQKEYYPEMESDAGYIGDYLYRELEEVLGREG